MTSNYANPRTWSGKITDVKLRDVFQVVSADCDKNPNLHAGDFYIANYEGDIKDYPANGRDDDNWYFIAKTWSGVTNIQLSTDNGQTASIYANGLQMTRVYVHMEPTDQGGKEMTVDPVTRLNAITLVNYNTGEALKKIDTPTPEHPTTESGWLFCTTPNDFVTRDEEGNADDDNNTLTLYVLCNDKNHNSSMSIGVSIQPSSGLPVLDTANNSSGNHSQVTVTAKATPAIARLTRDDFVMTAVNMPHNGQLADDANDFIVQTQTSGNLWRQNNFYLQLNSSTGRKIKQMMITCTQDVIDNDRALFADYISDGFRTRAYLWNKDQKNAQVKIFNNLSENIIASERDDAVCVTYITCTSAVDSYFEGSQTSLVHATIYDTDGNSFDFCPNHYLPEKYSSIIDITQHYNQYNMVDKVFLLGTTTSPVRTNSEISQSPMYIYNTYYQRCAFPAQSQSDDLTYIGDYLHNDALYQYKLNDTSSGEYKSFNVESISIWSNWHVERERNLIGYARYRIFSVNIYGYAPDDISIAPVPVWTLNSFYIKCLNDLESNCWVGAIPDTDINGSKSLEWTNNEEKVINSEHKDTSNRLWQFKARRS